MRPQTIPTDFPHGLKLSYRLNLWCGTWRHSYVIEGAKGAIEFTVSEYGKDRGRGSSLERHLVTPDGDAAPDHPMCQTVSFRTCWHDGTSLYAEENLLPQWEECGGDHGYVFNMVLREYHKHFGEEAEPHG